VNWKRSAIAVLFAAPLLALLAWGFRRDPNAIPSPLPGKTAPTFALSVFSPGVAPRALPIGDTVRLFSLRGRIVVLNFWASWCLVCRDEHATLTALAKRYEGSPVDFVGVLYNDDTASGLKWIREMGGQTYPSVNDPDARTAIDYGIYGVPETFVVDPSGRVVHKEISVVSAETMTHVLDSLLAAAPQRTSSLR
jgi:cytochrome c biogenesis protein CcmG/thiol:disulfide interchange protein DsbE